ncbi:MAG: PHP domain-containing protein [Clostridia bacterium]|nr:PHP domain-containing protein [Clostridia bacterium]
MIRNALTRALSFDPRGLMFHPKDKAGRFMVKQEEIVADLHTHTRYSHGKGLIFDNVEQAKKIGLMQIGISDHGVKHMLFGLRKWKVKEARDIVDRLNGDGIEVLFGVEANILDSKGNLDSVGKYSDYFDYVIAGYHKASLPSNPAEFFRWNMSAICMGNSRKNSDRVRRHTKAYIEAIKSGRVNIISHPNLDMSIDVIEVGKAARDYGVLMELNGKRVMMSDDDICELVNLNVNFILSSDAHSVRRVGDFSVPLAVVNRLNIPARLIANTHILNFKKR